MSKKSLYTAAIFSLMSICWSQSVFAAGILDCNAITTECLKRFHAKDSDFCKAFTDNRTPGSGGVAEGEAFKTCNTHSVKTDACRVACRDALWNPGHCKLTAITMCH